eukprot:TRINITY_DN13422_c0_g1_i1.p1 TRINITY_DN13422_c0_g1~~TRINITY_DN13422_c0_g1_i1.p1  ORF type:complete len:420 (+),score=95.18 TRINITY_DN13422_c0_g1_i1:116-1375(+)
MKDSFRLHLSRTVREDEGHGERSFADSRRNSTTSVAGDRHHSEEERNPRTFITSSGLSPTAKSRKAAEDIADLGRQLNEYVENLHDHVEKAIGQTEKSFLFAYKTHYYQLLGRLHKLERLADEQAVKLARDEKVNQLELRVKILSEECPRLFDDIKKKDEMIRVMKSRIGVLEQDRNFYEKQLRNIKRVELRAISQPPALPTSPKVKQAEAKQPQTEEPHVRRLLSQPKEGGSPEETVRRVERFVEDEEAKYRKTISHLQRLVEGASRERDKARRVTVALQAGANDLQRVFADCVEKVAADLRKRRLKLSFDSRADDESPVGVLYDGFGQNERKVLLEEFLSTPELVRVVQKHLSPGSVDTKDPGSRETSLLGSKDSMNITSDLKHTKPAFKRRIAPPTARDEQLRMRPQTSLRRQPRT